jgi:hypothetical protein
MTKMLRSIGTIVLAFGAAALFAASAQADRPDDRAGMLGLGGASGAAVSVRPDDRAGTRGIGAVEASQPEIVPDVVARLVATRVDGAPGRPDDRAGARGPGIVFPKAPLGTVTVSADAFEWADATIGAAATLSVILLAGALALTVRQRRRISLP